tara:strand:+ start:14904 stop:17012 length:2109 start_codon:yes stop_codon:yes gene_type:complete
MNEVSPLFQAFRDVAGNPLEAGKIYIGSRSLDAITSPKAVFWDVDRTIPASQPIRTLNGYPSRDGSAARVFTSPGYSMTVLDKDDVLQFSTLDVTFGDNAAVPSTANVTVLRNPALTSTGQTAFTLDYDLPLGFVFIDGVQQSLASYSYTFPTLTFTGTVASGSIVDALFSAGSAAYSLQTFETVANVLADTTFDYDNIGVGASFVTRKEGFAYEVAAAGATDHHLTTAGGLKLYVLQGSNGWDVLAFGADNTGVASASAAINAAILASESSGTVYIAPGEYNIDATVVIPLGTAQTRLRINAYGALFSVTGAIAAIARERPTSVSSSFTAAKYSISGLRVEGDNTVGQHGFRFFTTYGLSLVDCQADSCEIGFCIVFGLMTSLETCFATNCGQIGFFFGSGGSKINFGGGVETAITGGNYSNSNSNGSVADRCRVFALGGSNTHFKIEACEMELRSPIAEGGITANCFEYDNFGSTVSKGITIIEPHIECAPTNALYKIHTSTGTIGGVFIIDGQDTVITGGATPAIFDVGTLTNAATIKMTGNKFLPTPGLVVKGSNSTRNPTFLVDTVNPDTWTDVAKFGSGTLGNVQTTAPMFNGSNQSYELRPYNHYLVAGGATWDFTSTFSASANNGFIFNMPTNIRDFKIVTAGANYGLIVDGRLFQKGPIAVASPTLGTLQGRMPVYDENKTFLGYAPLYSTIA